jgi:hypothetical protein
MRIFLTQNWPSFGQLRRVRNMQADTCALGASVCPRSQSAYESRYAKEGRFPLFIPEGGLAADITTLQPINTFVTKDYILLMN